MSNVLGVNAVFHDPAAAVVVDGETVAAAEEERFSRRKHGKAPVAFSTWELPEQAMAFCLAEAGLEPADLDAVAYSYDPWLAPQNGDVTAAEWEGLRTLYARRAPLFLRSSLPGLDPASVRWVPHHVAHAASATFASGMDPCDVLVVDGRGERTSHLAGRFAGGALEVLAAQALPHSLGLLYEELTAHLGFRRSSDEYKVMALASYGEPSRLDELRRLIRADGAGGFAVGRVDLERFAPAITNGQRLARAHADLAAGVQRRLEEVLIDLAAWLHERTGSRYLAMAGGVALNCVANGVLLREGIFDDLWIQPAAGDAGGALGAPLAVWHNAMDKPRTVTVSNGRPRDAMRGSLLGPDFPREQIKEYLDFHKLPYQELPEADWARRIAELIAGENVIGLCQGRMEFGPRALGGRSIIGDARSPKMQSVMNLKIKYRESFRPFAPSVLEERVSDYFELDRPSPYMLLVADVVAARRVPKRGDEKDLPLLEWVNRPRSDVPAITHVDYSARIQTVGEESTRYHAILTEFEKLTGYGVIVNTSFNVRGEPIVCTPEDAYRCFMRTEMDYLVVGPFLLDKKQQPALEE
jgi:carbamoyltransferase